VALIKSALTTAAKVRKHLGIGTDEHDEVLEDIIDAVTMKFEQVTRRRLKARTFKASGADYGQGEVDLKLNGDDRLDEMTFQWPEWPLNTLTALVIRDDQGDDPVTITLPTHVIIDRELGRVTLKSVAATTWRLGRQNIEATFNAGLDATKDADKLAHIEALALSQILHDFRMRDKRQEGISSISVEGQSVSYIVRHLLPDVEHGLQQHERGAAYG
jgi:hypothetical protein